MRRQVCRDQRRSASAHVIESSPEGGSDLFRLAHGFTVAVSSLRKLGEIRRWIENAAIVVAGANRYAVRISSHQTIGTRRVGAVNENNAQESRLVVRSRPERGERRAEHEVAVAAGENDVVIGGGQLGADSRADAPTPR